MRTAHATHICVSDNLGQLPTDGLLTARYVGFPRSWRSCCSFCRGHNTMHSASWYSSVRVACCLRAALHITAELKGAHRLAPLSSRSKLGRHAGVPGHGTSCFTIPGVAATVLYATCWHACLVPGAAAVAATSAQEKSQAVRTWQRERADHRPYQPRAQP